MYVEYFVPWLIIWGLIFVNTTLPEICFDLQNDLWNESFLTLSSSHGYNFQLAGDAANFVPQKLFPWLLIQPSFSQSTLSSGLTWVSGFHISQDLEEKKVIIRS